MLFTRRHNSASLWQVNSSNSRLVIGMIFSEFCGILHVFVNFADLLEIHTSVTAPNTRSPDLISILVDFHEFIKALFSSYM